MKKIILASSSPRRRALMSQTGIPFEVITEDFDEQIEPGGAPQDIVMELARRKAAFVCQTRELNALVIAADTIVWHEGRSYGKPKDEDDAYAMLNSLQGKSHHVYTGVCVMDKTDDAGKVVCFSDCAEVRMRCVSERELLAYCRTGEPFGKAGAYAIQGKAALLVEGILGDYNTVVGLPIVRVCLCLRDLGFDITECW